MRHVEVEVTVCWVKGRAEDDDDEVTLPPIQAKGISRASGSCNH